MKHVSVNEAKAHFSAIMRDVEAGEVVIVTRHGKPVIEMRAVGRLAVPRLGAFAEPGAPHLEVSWTPSELDELLGED